MILHISKSQNLENTILLMLMYSKQFLLSQIFKILTNFNKWHLPFLRDYIFNKDWGKIKFKESGMR